MMCRKPSIFIISSLFIFQYGLAQEKVILDTDPSGDPDDVGCMAMLHTLASLGECEILAIINVTGRKESPLSISAINYFYKRKAIPVGDFKTPAKTSISDKSYAYLLANEYPRSLENWENAIDAVSLYREILSSAEDSSITIVVVGSMRNIYGLLKSEPDDYSDKSGVELIGKKVKLIVSMGGNFINGRGIDRANWGGSDEIWGLNKEQNRITRYVLENCSAPLVASGWEVGDGNFRNANFGRVATGQGLKKLENDHIVRRAYEYHYKQRGHDDEKISRHSNDQCALLYAIRGEGENFKAVNNGKITLTENAVTFWTGETNYNQGYLKKVRDSKAIAREIEELMMGNVPDKDLTPPSPPENIRYSEIPGDKRVIYWDHAEDTTKGSWVVGYNIYKNGKFIRTAYGNKFMIKGSDHKATYAVNSVNTNGVESSPEYIQIK
jgi:hypothetical protein